VDELEGREVDLPVRHQQVDRLAGNLPSVPIARASSRAISPRPAAVGRALPALGQDLEGPVPERAGGQDGGRLAVGHVAGGATPPDPGVVIDGRSSRMRLAV